MTAEELDRAITPRTKWFMFNSPSTLRALPIAGTS